MRELMRSELQEINGGLISITKWVKGGFWVIAANFIIDNWTEIKSGAIDGWTDGKNDD